MAKVKIEDVVDHLSSQMRKALAAAVNQVAPNAAIDEHALYRAFRRAVGRKCNSWEDVPDHFVER